MLSVLKTKRARLGSMKRGFTLIELLVVIAILAILLVIVLVAVNPARQTRDARNTQRRADVLTVLNSVNKYFIENGDFPDGPYTVCPTTQNIGTADADVANGSVAQGVGAVPDFVADLPTDPAPAGTAIDTGYDICATAGDRITVSAPNTEGGIPTITVTR